MVKWYESGTVRGICMLRSSLATPSDPDMLGDAEMDDRGAAEAKVNGIWKGVGRFVATLVAAATEEEACGSDGIGP